MAIARGADAFNLPITASLRVERRLTPRRRRLRACPSYRQSAENSSFLAGWFGAPPLHAAAPKTNDPTSAVGIVRVNSILPARAPRQAGAPLFLLTNYRRLGRIRRRNRLYLFALTVPLRILFGLEGEEGLVVIDGHNDSVRYCPCRILPRCYFNAGGHPLSRALRQACHGHGGRGSLVNPAQIQTEGTRIYRLIMTDNLTPARALSHEPELATRSPEVPAGVMQPSRLAMSGTPHRGGRGGCGER
jgi:hypothetical protein